MCKEITRDFRETIRERVQRQPTFQPALLRESVEQMLAGDVETGNSLIRNYSYPILATPAEISKAIAINAPPSKPQSAPIPAPPPPIPQPTPTPGITTYQTFSKEINY